MIFFDPSKANIEFEDNEVSSEEKYIVNYLEYIRNNNDNYYNIFKEILFGSIILLTIFAKDSSQIINTAKKQFKECEIFLDTNIVLSLLGFHLPEINQQVKELINLLNDIGVETKVFDFTLDEVCGFLKRYKDKEKYFPPETLALLSLYKRLDELKWTNSKIDEFIIEIEKIIISQKIKIVTTNVILGNYDPVDPNFRSSIIKYKPYQNREGQDHDLAAIQEIINRRGKKVRQFIDTKSLFLSSDGRLSKFNFIEMGHKYSGTISEVIIDRLLSYILWFQYPASDLPLNTIIAAYTRNGYITRGMYESFYELIEDLKRNRHKAQLNIHAYLYSTIIEGVLK